MSEITDLTRGVYRRLYGGFITGQRISKLSLNAEAWFWRVLVSVDDFGNGRADPDLCKAATAGNRKVTTRQVSDWLREMKNVGLIQFYTVKGEPLLHIVGFEENQPAGRNGKRFKRFATPDESGGIQVNPDLPESSVSDTDTDTENDHKPSGKPANTLRIFEYWKEQMKHPNAQLTDDRKKKIQERLADSTVEEIETAIRGCKSSDFHMGREPGHPQKFDDIELICRKRSKLESFIALAPPLAGPKRVETIRDRLARESCERCHATGSEIVEGKGARTCDHTNAVSGGSSESVEGSPENRQARIS